MASSITIDALRAQVTPVPIKFCPLAEEHKFQMDEYSLSENPNPLAVEYVTHNYSIKALMFGLSKNPSAIAFLEKNLQRISLSVLTENAKLTQKLFSFALNEYYYYYKSLPGLCANPSDVVVNRLLDRPDKPQCPEEIHSPYKIEWSIFCKNTNPRAVAFMKQNKAKLNWSSLSGNTNDDAIQLLKENPEKIDFDQLSMNSNPKAFELLLTFPDNCINYNNLSANTNPKAVAHLINNRPDEINWYQFSRNSSAMDYLVANPDNVNFVTFWENPAILYIDEPAVCKERSDLIKQELLDIFMSPDRIDRLRAQGISFREIIDNF